MRLPHMHRTSSATFHGHQTRRELFGSLLLHDFGGELLLTFPIGVGSIVALVLQIVRLFSSRSVMTGMPLESTAISPSGMPSLFTKTKLCAGRRIARRRTFPLPDTNPPASLEDMKGRWLKVTAPLSTVLAEQRSGATPKGFTTHANTLLCLASELMSNYTELLLAHQEKKLARAACATRNLLELAIWTDYCCRAR